MEQKKIRYYVVIGILIIYLILMFVFFIYPALKDKNNETYIIVNKDAKWMYEDGKWQDITDKQLYNWQLFDVYNKNNYLGNYYLLYNDGWYLYDQNRNPVIRDNVDLFAIKTNQNYKYGSFVEEKIKEEDMKYVYQVLEDHDITSTDFSTDTSFSFDLDQDGIEEKVFTVSNMFLTTTTASKNVFNFIFAVKNEEIIMILEMVDSYSNMYDHCKAYVSNIVDINGDANYEIITGCGYYADRGQCMEMYEYNKNSYKRIKSCEN